MICSRKRRRRFAAFEIMLVEPLLSKAPARRAACSSSKDVVSVCIIAIGAVLLLCTTLVSRPSTAPDVDFVNDIGPAPLLVAQPPGRYDVVHTASNSTTSTADSPTAVANRTRAPLAQQSGRAPMDELSDGEEAADLQSDLQRQGRAAEQTPAPLRSPEIRLWSTRLGGDTWWSWWCAKVGSSWCI